VLPESLSRLGCLEAIHVNWVWSDLRPLFSAGRGLTSLRTLRAIGNGITEVPECIGDFGSLRCGSRPAVTPSLSPGRPSASGQPALNGSLLRPPSCTTGS
jgi:hypothetical protein